MSQYINCDATYDGVTIASLPGLRGLLQFDPANVDFHPTSSEEVINGVNLPVSQKITVVSEPDTAREWRATVFLKDGRAIVI